jgi:hypothetical protein
MGTSAIINGGINAYIQYETTGTIQWQGIGGVLDAAGDGALLGIVGGGAALSTRTASVKAGASAETAKDLVSYYPPNRGFLGEPGKASLIPGTKIDRYGSPTGTFVAPEGTPFPMRSLPENAKTRPLNKYKVTKPIEVDAGPAAPWFGQPGGGLQFELPKTVQELTESGHLRSY